MLPLGNCDSTTTMTDPNFVLRWAHLGRGRPRPLRHREIIEEQRRAFEAHVAEIQAEQEQKYAELVARKARFGGRPPGVRTQAHASQYSHLPGRWRSNGVGRTPRSAAGRAMGGLQLDHTRCNDSPAVRATALAASTPTAGARVP